MKRTDKLLKYVVKSLSNFAAISKRNPSLSALDRGVLTVALMVSALDGEITPGEYSAYLELSKKCRGYSEKNAKQLLQDSLARAGYLMAMAQVDAYSIKERLDSFITMAVKALPNGFELGTYEDVNRAFMLWTAMGLADGEFSELERKAMIALAERFANIRYTKAKDIEDRWIALSPVLRQATGSKSSIKKVPLLAPDFFDKAEETLRKL